MPLRYSLMLISRDVPQDRAIKRTAYTAGMELMTMDVEEAKKVTLAIMTDLKVGVQ